MSKFKHFLTSTLTVWCFSAPALELQTLIDGDCKSSSGAIVHVDDTHVDFINLDGRHELWPIEKVDSILIYNILQNPFRRFAIDEKAAESLKELYLEDSQEPTAAAWPVKFIDDLIIYFSIDGKTHVHTLGDLYRIRSARPKYLGDREISYQAVRLAWPDGAINCPNRNDKGIQPTRVLADRIRVSNYLESFNQGYEALESFQERTYLYAKPFLYRKNSRLGFVIMKNGDEPASEFPLYFQWSKGKPYRFQSETVFGRRAHEVLPNTEPVFALRTDVKSHVFHALFIGNLFGMSAGTSVLLDGTPLTFSSDLSVMPSFNYMALMGGDYGPYSFSFGFYYPSYGFKIHQEQREVLGSQLGYAFRAMFTKRRYRLRAITSIIKVDRAQPSKADLISLSNGSASTLPNSFKFDSIFVRGGVDYDWNRSFSSSLDLISVSGHYNETTASFINGIDFNRLTVQASVSQSFSDYVSLGATANFNQFIYKSNFSGIEKNNEKREARFFGTFEFVF